VSAYKKYAKTYKEIQVTDFDHFRIGLSQYLFNVFTVHA